MNSELDFERARRAVDLGWVSKEQVESAILETDRDPGTGIIERLPLTDAQRSALAQPVPSHVATAMQTPANRFGKFVLLRHLKSGGMGKVYEAWDLALSRRVAMKFPKAPEDDRARAWFDREARLAAAFVHPNAAAIYEVGDSWIAMQFIEGKTLAEGRPPRDVAIAAMRDAARAVGAAHEQGIIHRDLKPGNLMLDGEGRVFVLDFGLAKQSSETGSLSGSSLVVGTPEYMSPEQAKGSLKEVDAASDVYSLGACLYDLLTGHPPFTSESRGDLLAKVIRDEVPAPKNLPRDLETIILTCLEKEKTDRYRDARELAADLDRHLRGEAIRAKRHRGAGRAVKALAGFALLGLTIWLVLRSLSGPAITVLSRHPRLTNPSVACVGDGKIYVPGTDHPEDMALLEIDPRTGAVRELGNLGCAPNAIQKRGDRFWIVDPNSGPGTSTQIFRWKPLEAIYTGLEGKYEPVRDGSGMALWGDRLFVVDQVGGAVWSFDLEGGDAREFTPPRFPAEFSKEHGGSLVVANGVLLLLSAGRGGVAPPGLFRLPDKGGSYVKLHEGSPFIRPSSVAFGDQRIFVADPGAGNTIWEVPWDGGAPKRLVSGPPFVDLTAIVWVEGALYAIDRGDYVDAGQIRVDGPGTIFRISLR